MLVTAFRDCRYSGKNQNWRHHAGASSPLGLVKSQIILSLPWLVDKHICNIPGRRQRHIEGLSSTLPIHSPMHDSALFDSSLAKERPQMLEHVKSFDIAALRVGRAPPLLSTKALDTLPIKSCEPDYDLWSLIKNRLTITFSMTQNTYARCIPAGPNSLAVDGPGM